jgi:anti-sigma factor RsiW
MKDQHMGEAIELYALGVLDRDEARSVEEHAATCAECARLLGDAERTIAELDTLTVPLLEPPPELAARIGASSRVVVPLRARRPSFTRWAALAASLVVAAVGVTATREIATDRATIAADDRAFSSIAVSHFAHTTFTKALADAPTAKVLWGKAPRWLYVIVDSAACDCSIVAITPTGERDLGTPATRGNTATLFDQSAPDVTRLELRRGSETLSSAQRP